jgi:hypothetical protein
MFAFSWLNDRHLPPWLLPGYRRSVSTMAPTESRTWKE